jgi:tetratricopeptide (TPR) repeat protein
LAGNAEEKEENMAAIYEALYLSQEKEDYAGAESAYRAVLSRDLRPSTRDLATFNLGITLKVQKRYDDAIAVLQSILDSRVDSYDAGESVMEASIDYRYESCIQIADCYQRQGKFREALDYRILARDKYKYRTDCSSCAKYESDSERSIIKELTEKVATAK